MLIEWTDSLLVGHQRIDSDHKALVIMINRLHEAILSETGRATISEIIHFLAEQTYRHFMFEEWLMITNEFPGAQEHLTLHRSLVDELDALLYSMEMAPDDALLEAVTFFESWFVTHVVCEDLQLGRYLSERERERERAAAVSAPPPS